MHNEVIEIIFNVQVGITISLLMLILRFMFEETKQVKYKIPTEYDVNGVTKI